MYKSFYKKKYDFPYNSKISNLINSLTTEKQTTKFSSANFQKIQIQAITYWEFKD